MKKEITKGEYWAIVGLLALSRSLTRQVQGIEQSLMELTGDEEFGHCGDMVWDFDGGEPRRRANKLLKNLGILVSK